MDAVAARRIAFFILYAVALVSAFVWVQLPRGGAHPAIDRRALDVGFAAASVYLCLRAYLVLRLRISESWEPLWLGMDLLLLTAGVHVTGGFKSDLALLYVWPLVTASVQRRPRLTSVVGLSIAALYAAVAFPDAVRGGETARLAARLFVVAAATAVAVAYAVTEAARVEELTRLRERLALSDYRSRLSREMHDGIQHYLIRIVTRLNLARTVIDKEPERAARIALDQALTVRQANDELRYLVRRLRSPVVEQQGFVGALQPHIEMFAERADAQAELRIEGEPRRLPPDVEQAAFRIIQEALTNAEKYADADRVEVQVVFGEDSLTCSVTDNGRGFDASAPPTEAGIEGGFGLPGMRERAESAGGKLSVESAPGHGTTVTFSVPLSPADEEQRRDAEDQAADR